VILSTLYPHECKISAMHFKIKRTLENTEIVPSKAPMEFSCGFRRLTLRPTFSMELNAAGKNDKLRYMRFLRKDMSVIATAYCPIVYQPSKIIAFTKRGSEPVNMDVVASGIALPADPLKVILKRIILTGYPLRCHKKRATIRYMFFDPKDIKYFKPVELYTQAGLRGHIKDSLGTHGLMKCHFNDYIKQSDVVCMPLYRRVYPEWYERTWNPRAAEPIKKGQLEYRPEDEEMD
jgi:pre-rRNA-processing protein TSR1